MGVLKPKIQVNYRLPQRGLRKIAKYPRFYDDMVVYCTGESAALPARGHGSLLFYKTGLYDVSTWGHHGHASFWTTDVWGRDEEGPYFDYTEAGTPGIFFSDKPVTKMPLTQPWTIFIRWNLSTAPTINNRFRVVFGFADTNLPSSSEAILIAVLRSSGLYYHKIASVGETAGNGAQVLLNTWYTSAIVFDGSDLHAYLNGKFDYSVTPNPNDWKTSTWLKVGNAVNITLERFFGKIGHIGAWGRMLSPWEIQLLHDNPNAPLEVKGFNLPLPPAAPAVNPVPVFMHHYRQLRTPV